MASLIHMGRSSIVGAAMAFSAQWMDRANVLAAFGTLCWNRICGTRYVFVSPCRQIPLARSLSVHMQIHDVGARLMLSFRSGHDQQ